MSRRLSLQEHQAIEGLADALRELARLGMDSTIQAPLNAAGDQEFQIRMVLPKAIGESALRDFIMALAL